MSSNLMRYHYGVELFKAERFAEAAAELVKAADGIDPNTSYLPEMLRYLVMSYQNAGLPEKALEVARLGLQYFPDYADLYYFTGLFHLELKQYVLAQEAFANAVSMPEQQPQYASFGGVRGFRSYYYLGQIAEIFLKYEDALKFYISALRDNPEFTAALKQIVKILKPYEDPQYAKECLEKVFEFSTLRSILMMGEICFQEGAYQLALDFFERHPEENLLPPEIKLHKAICLIHRRSYLESLRILDSYSIDNSLYPLARLNKLFCFWLQGNKKKVRALLAELRALGLDLGTKKVLSLFLLSLEKRDNNFLVTLEGDGKVLLLEIIKRLAAMGETDKAVQLVRYVEPGCLEQEKVTIARLFYDYGYKDKAEAFLREYLTDKRDGEAYFLLAEICYEKGFYMEAEQHYRFALEINPAEPKYYFRQKDLYDIWRKKFLQEVADKYPESEVYKKIGTGTTPLYKPGSHPTKE